MIASATGSLNRSSIDASYLVVTERFVGSSIIRRTLPPSCPSASILVVRRRGTIASSKIHGQDSVPWDQLMTILARRGVARGRATIGPSRPARDRKPECMADADRLHDFLHRCLTYRTGRCADRVNSFTPKSDFWGLIVLRAHSCDRTTSGFGTSRKCRLPRVLTAYSSKADSDEPLPELFCEITPQPRDG